MYVLALLSLIAPSARGQNVELTKISLSTYSKAICNDGSPAAYYLGTEGSTSGNVLIYLEVRIETNSNNFSREVAPARTQSTAKRDAGSPGSSSAPPQTTRTPWKARRSSSPHRQRSTPPHQGVLAVLQQRRAFWKQGGLRGHR